MSAPILILDTASPTVSVAVGGGGEVLSERVLELRRSSEMLLRTIEEVLEEAGLGLGELAGVASFQGPGSFTGLRIGLATVLGFHQALGLKATALPTLPILAAAVEPGPSRVVAAVDAMRGDWSVRSFRPAAGGLPEVEDDARLVSEAELVELAPATLVGFGVSRLAGAASDLSGLELVEPPPLAPVALRVLDAGSIHWDPARLTRPIYFRPPAVTLPKVPSGVPK